jgi:hypothetical protein
LRYAYLNVDGTSAVANKGRASIDFDDRKKAPRRVEATLQWDTRTVANDIHKLDFVVWDLVGNATTRSFKVRVQGSPFKPQPGMGY